MLADGCFPGCDYTLKGDECGRPKKPGCVCDRNFESWCDPSADWEVIEVGTTSRIIESRSDRLPDYFRFNWDSICDGF